LIKGLKNLDFTLGWNHAEAIALNLLKGKDKIAVKDLCDILDCVVDESLTEGQEGFLKV